MTISETITGEVAITANGVTITLNSGDAFDLLSWLYDRRDRLYAGAYNIPYEPKKPKKFRLQALTDHISGGDTTIYRGGNDE